MCGIAGFVLTHSRSLDDPEWIARSMASALRHRGPDDSGVWHEAGVALAHRRLSIIDLSPAGHQPMLSTSGRFVMVFNGEIYNHSELRASLEEKGVRDWRGHSDTETLLAGIEAWGLKATLQRAVGMFAIALWDRETRSLTLTRDRMGEKPLYFGEARGAFLFASELKAFHAFPGFKPDIDQDSLALFFSFNYVPSPRSIFKGIRKLDPGTILTRLQDGNERAEPYWSLEEVFRAPRFSGTPEDAVSELDRRLSTAISLQSVADVPVGAFLSGGIDSSTVVALMQAQSSARVRTFSIGFHEEDYNEAPYAAAVAKHLGTDHTELMVTPGDAMQIVPRLPSLWDEPFADSSQIPTFIVAQLARRSVTVSLSGDGGDELFCGYDRYFSSHSVEKMPGRNILRGLLNAVPHRPVERLAGLLPARMGKGITERRLSNLAQLLNLESPRDRYMMRVAQWKDTKALVPNAQIDVRALTGFSPSPDTHFLDLVAGLDAKTYLPDDILVKVDRAAMAASLETRVPLLDHRVVELAFSLPTEYKVRGGTSKWPLRQVLYRHVPQSLMDRPKRGFGVPIADWLRGPLREWADDLLSEEFLRKGGLLNPAPVLRLWKQHKSGSHAWENRLWSVLMFQAWRTQYGY